MSAPQCPSCAGPWLDGWRFRHTQACALGAAQDTTQLADYERLGRYPGGGHRTPTTTELALAAVLGWPGAPAGAVVLMQVRPFAGNGLFRRSLFVAGRPDTAWAPPDPPVLDSSSVAMLGPTGQPLTP